MLLGLELRFRDFNMFDLVVCRFLQFGLGFGVFWCVLLGMVLLVCGAELGFIRYVMFECISVWLVDVFLLLAAVSYVGIGFDCFLGGVLFWCDCVAAGACSGIDCGCCAF